MWEEDISAFWHAPVRNPHHPDTPIPLGALLNHTSGLVDSPMYFRSFQENIPADALLRDADSFSSYAPFAQFRYSNFGAGLIGSLLEARFEQSIEALIQRELFLPLGIEATFDIVKTDIARVANSYRVLPPGSTAAFNAAQRLQTSAPIDAPDPQRHFLLASGNLYITARDMAKLCQLVIRGGMHGGTAFLDEKIHT